MRPKACIGDPMIDLDGKRVLLIKLRYIGDTLTLLPVIDNLKKKVPRATVDVMVNKGTEEILTYHPDIRKLWVYDRKQAKDGLLSTMAYHREIIRALRGEKYDLVIDFTHGDRAAFISFMTGAPQRVTYEYSTTLSRLLMNRVVRCDHRRHHIVDYQLESLRFLGFHDFERAIHFPIPDFIHAQMEKLLKESGIPSVGMRISIHPGE